MHASLVARSHRTTPFRTNGAVGILAHLALEAVAPALLGGDAHVPKGVFVNCEKAALETRIVGDIGHILRHARTVQNNVVAGHFRKFLNPLRI